MSVEKSNLLTGVIWGKVTAVIITAIGLLSLAKATNVTKLSGFVEMIVVGYTEVVDLIFKICFGWINVAWFEIDSVERQIISLIMIIVAGVSAWLPNKKLQGILLLIGFLLTAIILGIFVQNTSLNVAVVVAILIVALPIYALYISYTEIKFRTPLAFLPLPNFKLQSYEFRGVGNLIIGTNEVSFSYSGPKLTVIMIFEYFINVISALVLIFFLLAAGFVSLIP